MTVLVNDPWVAERVKAERQATDAGRHDEVWDGVYVVSPLANNEHQRLATLFARVFDTVLEETGLGVAFSGVNVGDREEDWLQNYREPDVAVFLAANPAKDCDTHWCGGPDIVVEIVSPNDLAREKRAFYAKVGVRELWILDRKPWALELYRLETGELIQAGVSLPHETDPVSSRVLPLEIRLIPGKPRPKIEIARTDKDESWLI